MNALPPEQSRRLREAPGPLYLKIAGLLRRHVESGRWPAGFRLPPLAGLAADIGVAVVTVRQAVAVLEDEGLLRREQGRGTFVTDAVNDGRWLVLRSDWPSLLGHLEGKKPRLIKTGARNAMPDLTPDDGTPAPAYRFMQRVHHWQDTPYAVVDIFLDRAIYRRAPRKFDGDMVIRALSAMSGVEIERMRQTFAFSTADLETAALLDTDVNAPVGDVRRVITASDGRVLYVGRARYRGDFVKLEMDIERP